METILLVEDDPAVRRMLGRLLIKRGYTVLEAGGAPEALALSQDFGGPIHLLITDVILPQTCCSGLVQRLKDHRPGLKVLYMSGYPHEVLERHGMTLVGPDFIQKPFTADRLWCSVRLLLEAPAAPRRRTVAAWA